MSGYYYKVISLLLLKNKEISRLDTILRNMGYKPSQDYRINYFNENSEMVILNPQLHKDLKLIRKTIYVKKAK